MKNEFGIDEVERERWWKIYRAKRGIRPGRMREKIGRLIFIAGWNAAAIMDKSKEAQK